MFLGPFIGLGLGWLAQLGFEFIFFLIAKTFVTQNVGIDPNLVIDKKKLLINLKLIFPEKNYKQ